MILCFRLAVTSRHSFNPSFSNPPVLFPLLFLLYIDDLRSVVPETVKVPLFADYVSLLSSHHNKLDAEKELQRAVTAVAEWSTSKKNVK